MCAIWRRSRGHVARVANAASVISDATSAKRTSRNSSGGAYGRPYFAAMNPVLHRTTNSPGSRGAARRAHVSNAAARCVTAAAARIGGRSLRAVGAIAFDACGDLAPGVVRPRPSGKPHPLAGLEILVVLEEMRDLRELYFRKVLRRRDRPIQRREAVDRHGEHLGVAARLVVHLQHADRPAAHDDAGDQWHRRDDEYVARIAVVRKRLRNVAVVARIVHRRRHEAIDEHGAGGLVDLVLDRLAVHRNLDDDVAVVRNVGAGGNAVETHEGSSRSAAHAAYGDVDGAEDARLYRARRRCMIG